LVFSNVAMISKKYIGSEKRVHFAEVTKFLLVVYWVRLGFKLQLPTFIRLRKTCFVKL